MARNTDFKGFIITIILVILALTVTTKCAAQNSYDYLVDFKKDAARFGKKLYTSDPTFVESDCILYLERDGEPYAVDAYVDHSPQVIYVDTGSNMWHNMPKILIYHELGHYYFTRGHSRRFLSNGRPTSLMNISWYTTGLSWSLTPPIKQDYYLRELFKK